MVRTNNRGAHAGKPTPSRVGTSVRGTRARGARAADSAKRKIGESRVGGVHPRSARVRVIAAAGATALLLGGLAFGWVTPQPGAEPTLFEGLAFRHFFLQPMDGPHREANTQAALRYCLEHPQWRLSLQTHKMLGIP